MQHEEGKTYARVVVTIARSPSPCGRDKPLPLPRMDGARAYTACTPRLIGLSFLTNSILAVLQPQASPYHMHGPSPPFVSCTTHLWLRMLCSNLMPSHYWPPNAKKGSGFWPPCTHTITHGLIRVQVRSNEVAQVNKYDSHLRRSMGHPRKRKNGLKNEDEEEEDATATGSGQQLELEGKVREDPAMARF